jgi:hypothetical protein
VQSALRVVEVVAKPRNENRCDGDERHARGEEQRVRRDRRKVEHPLEDRHAAVAEVVEAHDVQPVKRGSRDRRDADIGYLHDAATVLYPFAFEPLRTLVARGDVRFRDLGLRPGRGFRDPEKRSRILKLASVSPSALVTYAVRSVLSMLAGDAMLAPRAQ